MMRRRAATTILAAAVGASACGDTEPHSTTVSVRDSAGVTIVESREPRWGPDEAWTIAADPEVVIGSVEGDERYLLDGVWGLRAFDDGRIAVLDYGSRRVRLYDPEGRHLVDIGGPGEGPAEFNRPQYVGVLGDTVVVFQSAPVRLSWFDDGGAFLDARTIPSGSGGRPLFGWAFARFDDHSLAVAVSAPEAPSDRPGPAREKASIWRLHVEPPALDSLLPLDGEEVLVQAEGGWNSVEFGGTTWFAAGPGGIHTLETATYDLHTYDLDGRLTRIARRPFERRPVTDEHKRRLVEQLVAAQEVDEDRVPLLLSMLDQPGRVADVLPSTRMLVADRSGNLWVENFEDVGIEAGSFSVFDPDGVWLGDVDLPPGLPWLRGLRGIAFDIGEDWLLGVWTDELGVEQVRRYRIVKPGGG